MTGEHHHNHDHYHHQDDDDVDEGLSMPLSGRLVAVLVERRVDEVALLHPADRCYRKHASGDNRHAGSHRIHQLDHA